MTQPAGSVRVAMPSAPADDAPHILVVDDDARIRSLLTRYLARDGYRVTMAANAAEAEARMGALAFDLIVCDVMMPGESGVSLTRRLRAMGTPQARVPVLMLTARGETSARIEGLEAGADDYLAKPFEPRELSLRIGSILRRSAMPAPAAAPEIAHFGGFAFNRARNELRQGDVPVHLTERECEILGRLSEANGDVVARHVLAGSAAANDRTIDVQINRLRRKIEADAASPLHLQTVRGIGYRLVLDDRSAVPT